MKTMGHILFVLGLIAAAAGARAAEICNKPVLGQFATTTLCASEALAADGKPLAEGVNFAQNDDGLPWLFNRPRPGHTPVLTLKLKDSPRFRILYVENGWAPIENQTPNRFKDYGRAREILIETSTGHKQKFVLRDTPQQQELKLTRVIKPAWLRLTVVSTYDAGKPVAGIRNLGVNMEEFGLR